MAVVVVFTRLQLCLLALIAPLVVQEHSCGGRDAQARDDAANDGRIAMVGLFLGGS